VRKLTLDTENNIKDQIDRFPTKTDTQIAIETGCNRTTVAKYRKQMDLKYDSEFVRIVAGKFIKAYGRAEEYWLNQITRLEELKIAQDVTIMDKLAIEKHQTELQKNILYLASQGEVREVIKIMRMGKIPMLENQEG